ncbi:Universal stress protein/MT2698 [Mycobacterium basiliense]|uniref:Universal stress protein/MT2698 n=1 Tax=Mycobacterium basiliense TaxID=2094119 RepID=A0A447GFJ4_9MYCO|nr:universal stress protein [Mycobacterium basiliense]VDM89204.1 Universal stress protein/MT2698 [Mycobacterium basiliense]
MSKLGGHRGVVVGVDGSPGSKIAVQWAARDAELRDVPLTLAHVLPGPAGYRLASSVTPAHTQRWRDRGHRLLEDAHHIAREHCQNDRAQIYREMPCAMTVSALVELSTDAELLVVGCLGTGTLRGRHLGSVSSGLMHYAHCPVAVIHDDVQINADAERASVLVGIDESPESELAIAIAFHEASRRKVPLTAVHAWKPLSVLDPIVSLPSPGWPKLRSRQDQIVAERLAGWDRQYPDVVVHRIVARNDPAPELVGLSTSAQLVVVGGRGAGGFAGMLFGSVSAAVVLLTHIPVIVARRSLAES